MGHLLVWLLVGMLVLAWSGLCWFLRRLVVGHDGQGPQPQRWLEGIERWQLPAAWGDWLPMAAVTALKATLVQVVAAVELMLEWLPGLLGWLDPLLWVAWAVGLLPLLLLGLIGSVLVQALARGGHRPGAQAAGG